MKIKGIGIQSSIDMKLSLCYMESRKNNPRLVPKRVKLTIKDEYKNESIIMI